MPVIPAFDADAVPCHVTSTGGFSAPVSLECVNPPANLRCTVDPATVRPTPGGSELFHLSLTNSGVEVGNHNLQVFGSSSAQNNTLNYPFNIAEGDLNNGGSIDYGSRANLGCGAVLALGRGQSVSTRCNFQTSFAFQGDFTTSCEAPAGIVCSVDRPVVTPVFPTGVDITVTITAAPDAPLGMHTVIAAGNSADIDDGPQPRGEIFVDVT
jgi:hypothetical protein